jgi:hypothetical protein
MPLDGLSFSNSGIQRIISPSEIAGQATQVSQHQAETTIKKLDKKQKTENNLDQETEEDKGRDLQGRDSDKESKDESEKENAKREIAKKYKVKFNSFTDMVELIDKNTGVTVETITPEDLINLVAKSLNPSGILVDREI